MNHDLDSPDAHAATQCRVSVVIKAFNEEGNIAAAVESALVAVSGHAGEVILADSCSTDQTVAVAARYPIRIVQLADGKERACGVGPQLGYQHAFGEYVYVLDGDMKMVPGFLQEALLFMAQHPEVAGVAGMVVERNTGSLEYRERGERAPAHLSPGPVDRLDGGALYRRRAIAQAGYLSDRNLHSYEELEFAIRLRALGWKLWRLPIAAATHHGHEDPHYRLLLRRWQSGYICGLGELVRATSGRQRMKLLWRAARELRIYLAVLAWWAVLASVSLWPASAAMRAASFVLIASAPVLLMALRKRSIGRGVYCVVSWCFNAAGLVRGLLQSRKPPWDRIRSVVLKEPFAPLRTASKSVS